MPVHAFIFPGQGSQAVGMGRDLAAAFAAAREVFEEVDETLKQKLSKLMFEGPGEELTLTENTQPALMAHSLAVLRVLEREGGFTLKQKAAVVDEIARRHGLGEWQKKWSALVCAWRLPQTLVPADGDDHGLLIKPQTFVNLSGEAVQAVLAFHKIPASNLLVVVAALTLLRPLHRRHDREMARRIPAGRTPAVAIAAA